jgi:hypothetical protein
MIKLANLLKEITVNKPGSKIEIETYTDIDGTTYCYAKLPIDILSYRGEEDNFIGRKINNGILNGMLVYPHDYDLYFENGVEWNILKNYLDKIRVKYTTENIDGEECIFIPDRYIKIVKELNEITINKPNRGIFKAVTDSDCAGDSDLYIYFDLYYKDKLLNPQICCFFTKGSNKVLWYPNGVEDKEKDEILQLLDRNKIPYEERRNNIIEFDADKAIINYNDLISLKEITVNKPLPPPKEKIHAEFFNQNDFSKEYEFDIDGIKYEAAVFNDDFDNVHVYTYFQELHNRNEVFENYLKKVRIPYKQDDEGFAWIINRKHFDLSDELNEITVNKPSIKLFDAEINRTIIDYENENEIFYYVKSIKNINLPTFTANRIKDNTGEYVIIMGYPTYDQFNNPVYFNQMNDSNNEYKQLIAYLDKYRVKYGIKNRRGRNKRIEIPVKYFNITDPNNIGLMDRPDNMDNVLDDLVFDELNEIEIYVPNRKLFDATNITRIDDLISLKEITVNKPSIKLFDATNITRIDDFNGISFDLKYEGNIINELVTISYVKNDKPKVAKIVFILDRGENIDWFFNILDKYKIKYKYDIEQDYENDTYIFEVPSSIIKFP